VSASNSFESAVLALIFQNANIANLGDATGVRGSTTPGTVDVALHSSDPGEAGTQSTNEIAYTGYARATVARSSGAWSLTGTAPTQVSNISAVAFPACTGGSATATHFSIGYNGTIIVSGALGASLAISNGITPSYAAGQLVANCD
jgi:hypothetical protein